MQRILRRRPSPALIVSCLALFVALGGSAYALTITGSNVSNNSLTGADIRDVKAGDIRNYTLHGRDAKRDSFGRVAIKEERLDASKFGTVKNAEAVGGATAKRFEAFTLDPEDRHRSTAQPFGGTREAERPEVAGLHPGGVRSVLTVRSRGAGNKRSFVPNRAVVLATATR